MLRIRLVGELRLDLDERRLDTIASRRARSLLAWLAYHPGLHPRTRVAAVFWPDVLESSARASLRTTLATLRRALGDEPAGHLVAGRDRLGIESGADVWIDVREIGRLVAEGRRDAALALCGADLTGAGLGRACAGGMAGSGIICACSSPPDVPRLRAVP